MEISPTYADRADLGRVLKWKFTIEERIGQNSRMQKMWHAYRALPPWVDDTLILLFTLLALVSLFVGDFLADVSAFFETEERDGPNVWLLYLILVAAICYFIWWGLMLFVTLFPFCFLLWLHTVMDDYVPTEATR